MLSVQFEEDLSGQICISSFGKIIGVDVDYQSDDTLVSVRFLQSFVFTINTKSRNKKAQKKSVTQKKRGRYRITTALVDPLKKMITQFKFDQVRIDVNGGFKDPHKTGILSSTLPFFWCLSHRNIHIDYCPDFFKSSLSLKAYCQVHFLGARLIIPAFGMYQSIKT